jgi:ubiquinone/menaquinone biosynthesis C-methylase UbiE
MVQSSSAGSATEGVARLFDVLAPVYDQTGVEFFGPIAERLVNALAVQPGERTLDLGCGRGAVAFRLAAAVGPGGSVTAVDLAPEMVRLTRAEAERAGLRNLEVEVMDAARPTLPESAYDVVASSLVLFFLPDPAAALTSWLRLVAPGGRVGVTTFGPQDDVWRAVDGLFRSRIPPDLLDSRTSGTRGPFASDEGMDALFADCGAVEMRTFREPLPVVFDDPAAWRTWSMSVGQRAMWGLVPEEEREDLFREASELLETARDAGGKVRLTQEVRYTLARVG